MACQLVEKPVKYHAAFVTVSIVANENISDLDGDKSWYVLHGEKNFAEDKKELSGGGASYLSREELRREGETEEKEGGGKNMVRGTTVHMMWEENEARCRSNDFHKWSSS